MRDLTKKNNFNPELVFHGARGALPVGSGGPEAARIMMVAI
jgi:hypothetical protein